MRPMRLCVPPISSYGIWRRSGETTSCILMRSVSDGCLSIGLNCLSALTYFATIVLGVIVSGGRGLGSGLALFGFECRLCGR